MNKYYLLSIIFFSISLFFFIMALINKQVEFVFILFFPIIIGSGINALFSFIFLLIAIILLIFGFVNLNSNNSRFIDYDTKKSLKFKGLIFLGPIPILIGLNWKITLIMMILGIFIIIILLSFFKVY